MNLMQNRLALLAAAAALTLPLTCAANVPDDTAASEIAGMMMDPDLWKALGSVSPGTVAGITHDVYRNSAFIAEALMRKHGVQPPYEKLTDNPAIALTKFREYGQRALARDDFMPSVQSCGIAVAHAYGSTFAYMLQTIEPSLVQAGINAADTRQMLDDARLAARGDLKLLRALCDDAQFFALNDAYRGFMGEMYASLVGMVPGLLEPGIFPGYTEDLAAALDSDLIGKLRAARPHEAPASLVLAAPAAPAAVAPAAAATPAGPVEDRSPYGLRRAYRQHAKGKTDDALVVAASYDRMIRVGHPVCDSLAVRAYEVALDPYSSFDHKLGVITDEMLDSAINSGCLKL